MATFFKKWRWFATALLSLPKGCCEGKTTRELTAQFHQAMQVSLELIGTSKEDSPRDRNLGAQDEFASYHLTTAANGAPAISSCSRRSQSSKRVALIDRLRAAEGRLRVHSAASIESRRCLLMRVVESASNPENANVLVGDGVYETLSRSDL
ncbi:MAG: hypothetical protein U0905_10275 [Pirellulales bacterium]